jgi:hypothetical protein
LVISGEMAANETGAAGDEDAHGREGKRFWIADFEWRRS